MQPRNFYQKQVYKLRLPPNYDSDDSCLSNSDKEYLPPPKRSLCPSDSSSDEESNGSDGQPSTCALVENEVNANSEVSVKSEYLGLQIKQLLVGLYGKVLLQMRTLFSHHHERAPCQSLQI